MIISKAARRTLPALLALVLCHCPAGPLWAEVRLPQADGTTLTLLQPASRIISLAPNIAEMLFEAGAGDLVAATVEFSDYPAGAAALPRIGDAFRFDLEQILAWQPDLVIGWQSGNPEAALVGLENLGLKVWRTEISNPDDIASMLQQIGRATGRGDSAEVAARSVRDRLTELRSSNRGKSKVSFFYQVAERPLYTVNGEHLISQGLSICGGVNIFADLPALAPQVSPEAVLLADPEMLIAPRLQGQADPLQHWRAWPRLGAVRSEQLVHLPADKISRATPRMLDSLELACTLLDGFRITQP